MLPTGQLADRIAEAGGRMTAGDLPARMVGRNGLPWLLVVGIVASVLARLVHWIVADRVWEDALITLAHVRNAAEGNGLTHHLGEGLVHGFTSALSVIVPLVGEVIWSGAGLTTIRLASLLAAVASVTAGYLLARQLGAGPWGIGFVMAYLAVDQLQIFFGMSGMETQIATAILLGGSLAVLRGHALAAGLLAGVAVLARPDFLLWAAIVAVWAGRQGLVALGRCVIALVAVVLPWLVFTLVHYGSPVPQTIVAKGLVYPTLPGLAAPPLDWLAWLVDRGSFALLAILSAFIPFYEDGLTVAAPIPAGVLAIAGITFLGASVAGAWLTRHVPNWWPSLLYVIAFALYWAALLPLGYFMWYQPPFLALAAVLAGVAISRLHDRWGPVGSVVALGLCVAVAIHLPWSIPLDRKTQLDIENGVRRPAGEFLAEVVAPGEAVTTEAAGYTGWYGQVELWDYPGLTSPAGLAAVRSLPRDRRQLTDAVAVLRPEWLVLRPHEWERLAADHGTVADCYAERRRFGAPAPPIVELNGLARWNQDHALSVFRRISGCDP